MPRLFVAIDLPPMMAAKLLLLQPQPAAGLKLTKAGQMHLTLHFIGEAEVEPVALALQAITEPAFSIRLGQLGQFRSHNGGVALWAGIQSSDPLLNLRSSVLAALATAGLRPKVRGYTPHITLARCKAGVPGRIARDFLAQTQAISSACVPVTGFVLYSSLLTDDGPVYHREQSFALQGEAP